MRDRRFRSGALALLLSLTIIAAGCGNGDDDTTEDKSDSSRICNPSTPNAKCETVVVQLSTAASLSEVNALAKRFDGTPLAGWRTDAICVANVSGEGGPATTAAAASKMYSQFTYWNADAIVAKQNAEAPPATDGGYSTALRGRLIEEWTAATMPDVRFAGAAIYVARDKKVSGDEIVKTTTADTYETDGAAVLYLRGHEKAFEELFSLPNGSCP